MTRLTRRATALVLALVAGTLGASLVTVPASAAVPVSVVTAPPACQPVGVATAVKRAAAVFTGVVTEVERQDPLGGRTVVFTNTVEVDRIYKGQGDNDVLPVLTERTGPPETGLGPLEKGKTYVFFVRARAGSTDSVFADRCSGTAVATQALVDRVEQLRGEGRPAVPPPPIEAEFTTVADSEPTSFTRAAAPGAALVLVGLLGLVLVGRVSRRG